MWAFILETICYHGDPFSPKTVNTLRLLDSFDNFERHSNKDDILLGPEEDVEASIEKPEVILRLHKDEAAYLKPYVMELAEKSIEIFADKYRFRLKEPVQIELYPDLLPHKKSISHQPNFLKPLKHPRNPAPRTQIWAKVQARSGRYNRYGKGD